MDGTTGNHLCGSITAVYITVDPALHVKMITVWDDLGGTLWPAVTVPVGK